MAQNKAHRRLTQPKQRNRCHAMIRHQNADTMVLARALIIPALDIRHFEYYQGVNASHTRTG